MTINQRERVVYEAAAARLVNRSATLKIETGKAAATFIAKYEAIMASGEPWPAKRDAIKEAREPLDVAHRRLDTTTKAEAALRAILAEETEEGGW